MSENDSHPDNVKESSEGFNSDFSARPRSCTDCLCLALIIACWVAMTLVGFAAIGIIKYEYVTPGNPMRLIHPVDYQGRICGVDNGVKNKPLGYFLPTTAVLCVESCPTTNDINIFYCKDNETEYLDTLSNSALKTAKSLEFVSKGNCMYSVETEEVAYRCIFSGSSAGLNALVGNLNVTSSYNSASKVGGWFTKYMGDIMTLRGYVFGFGLGVSVGVGFLYLYFLRIPGLMFTVIWTAVLSIQVVLVIGTSVLNELAVSWEEGGIKSDIEVQVVKVFMWIGVGLNVLYFCLILVLRKRIMLAIGIIQQAGKALASMPGLIFLPIFQCAGCVIFLVPWFIYMLYLASSGSVQIVKVYNPYTMTETEFRQFGFDDNTKYAMLYMLFCWFWTSQFIIALGQLILATSVVCWYFTRDKSTIGSGTAIWATNVVCFYNAGTAAFGSLIIAIIATIRVIIAYLQSKAAKSKSRIAQAVLCCIQCCMWCMEKCIKFLNKNAYIQVAIHGYSFCKACRSAFFLILRNILRVAAVNMVSGFVLALGKIMIPSLTTLICYLAIIYGNPDLSANINGIIAPMVTVFLLSYFMSCMFIEIFGMTIETILLCYIADEEMFPPVDRYADGPLQESISTTQKLAAENKVHADITEEHHDNKKEITPVQQIQQSGPVLL